MLSAGSLRSAWFSKIGTICHKKFATLQAGYKKTYKMTHLLIWHEEPLGSGSKQTLHSRYGLSRPALKQNPKDNMLLQYRCNQFSANSHSAWGNSVNLSAWWSCVGLSPKLSIDIFSPTMYDHFQLNLNLMYRVGSKVYQVRSWFNCA